MTQPLTLLDSTFTNQYKSLLEIQRGITQQLEEYPFDLTKDEITQAVHQRMMAFWYFNVNNCKDLGREVNTVAADFFTETCLFFLKPLLRQKGLEVASERDIRKKNTNSKIIRPDLSIWKGDELVAVIELKVSNGWKGKFLTEHLDNRKKEIQKIWPEVFFGCIIFWNCFDKNGIAETNDHYIGLFARHEDHNHQPTGRTIEQLLVKAIPSCYANK